MDLTKDNFVLDSAFRYPMHDVWMPNLHEEFIAIRNLAVAYDYIAIVVKHAGNVSPSTFRKLHTVQNAQHIVADGTIGDSKENVRFSKSDDKDDSLINATLPSSLKNELSVQPVRSTSSHMTTTTQAENSYEVVQSSSANSSSFQFGGPIESVPYKTANLDQFKTGTFDLSGGEFNQPGISAEFNQFRAAGEFVGAVGPFGPKFSAQNTYGPPFVTTGFNPLGAPTGFAGSHNVLGGGLNPFAVPPGFGQLGPPTGFGAPGGINPFGTPADVFGLFGAPSAFDPFGAAGGLNSFQAPTDGGLNPFGAATAEGLGPFGATTAEGLGPFGAETAEGLGPFGVGLGPFGAGLGSFGAGLGPFGAGLGPFGAGFGPFGAASGGYSQFSVTGFGQFGVAGGINGQFDAIGKEFGIGESDRNEFSPLDASAAETASDEYENMKKKIEDWPPFQIGLALFDPHGSTPDLLSSCWRVNLKLSDDDSKKLADMLPDSGIDFDRHRREGVDYASLADELIKNHLILVNRITWITFDGMWPLGYMTKILSNAPLPELDYKFIETFGIYFQRSYDVRYLMTLCKNLDGDLSEMVTYYNLKWDISYPNYEVAEEAKLIGLLFFCLKNDYFEYMINDNYLGRIYRITQ